MPSGSAAGRTKDGKLGFRNLRAEAIWKMRELLDPESEITVALPPDPQLRADLASYRWKLISGGIIQIEMKEDIKKRIGRSPDDGDAVVMALATRDSRVQLRRNDDRAIRPTQPLSRPGSYASRYQTRRHG